MMIAILFKKHELNELPRMEVDNFIIHAHPGCSLFNIDNVKEFYLEGYGSPSAGLDRMSISDVVTLFKSNSRIDLL